MCNLLIVKIGIIIGAITIFGEMAPMSLRYKLSVKKRTGPLQYEGWVAFSFVYEHFIYSSLPNEDFLKFWLLKMFKFWLIEIQCIPIGLQEKLVPIKMKKITWWIFVTGNSGPMWLSLWQFHFWYIPLNSLLQTFEGVVALLFVVMES